MTLLDVFSSYRNIPIFSVAKEAYIRDSFGEDSFFVRSFSENETVYSSSTKERYVGIILSGSVAIHSDGGSERTLLKSAHAGEMFGIANLYAKDALFPACIRAKEKTEVVFIRSEAFQNFIENDPAVLRFYLELLSKKIVYLNRKIATYTADDTEHKLALFLLENQTDGSYTAKPSLGVLANLLGVGRASLYRALDKLTELHLISKSGPQIDIPDLSALSAFAHHT